MKNIGIENILQRTFPRSENFLRVKDLLRCTRLVFRLKKRLELFVKNLLKRLRKITELGPTKLENITVFLFFISVIA